MPDGTSHRRTRKRNAQPRCVSPGCKKPRAVNSDERTKLIPLCWYHISVAHAVEEEARRQTRLNHYSQAAEAEGKKPEEMFWAPDLFPSQQAQELQQRHEDKRDLDHYRALVASGKIPNRRNGTPQTSSPDGTVYYLRVGGYIKIGWTADLSKRMRSYAPDTLLLATEPGTRHLEQRRHKQFAVHRTHGREWYAMVPPLMQHIDRTAAQHGQPDPVAFSAQPVAVPEPRPLKSYVGGNHRGPGQSMTRRIV